MTKKKTGINVIIGNYFIIFLLIICTSQTVIAQADPCSKPKVNVKLIDISTSAYKFLNEQYQSQPKDAWQKQIQAKVIEALKNNSPGTQFIPDCGDACDYMFRYSVDITHSKRSEINVFTIFYLSFRLVCKNPCNIPGKMVDSGQLMGDQNIHATIKQSISSLGDIGKQIQEYEKSHPVPPRGPEMDISQDREYVSPLEKEREIKIRINLKNCKGEIVYDKKFKQLVFLPKKTKRGELKATKGFPQDHDVAGNILILKITHPVGASATYTLKKGVKPEIYPINIVTCGRDKMVEKKTEIHISGLEIKVSPQKRVINPGEETKIDIKLFKVNTKGEKTPVTDKLIELRIKGLINGQVFPSEEIYTDKDGKAILTYLAGDEDEKVTFHARFQPKNYSEYVQGKTSVKIIHRKVYAKVTYIKNSTRDFSEIRPEFYNSSEKSNMKENIKFTIYLECEEKPRIDYKFDKKSLKMKIRYYTYQIKTARISSSLYEGQISTHHKNIDAAGVRHESRCKYSKIGTDFELTPQSSKPTIGIRVDPTTGNMTRVHIHNYAVTGIVSHTSECSGVKRKRVGVDEKLVPYDQKDTRDSDLKININPTVGEECSKVADDTNKKFLRGECSEIRKGKYLTEEESYKWEVVIRGNE